ncbi:MAG: ABC transporter ATP-binding protein [Treponema sp.]|jgi:ABC-2 type transport system ATP-binding protein|nr:ABC transporter ATP-binding protein [Treponema sp.]
MLNVQNVTKIYGARKVLNNISFSVGDHEILGFLGPNGAGKSTTMNIIAGYTSSNEGTVTVNGREILEDPIGCKRQIGYLPERPPLYPDMTVQSYLSFMYDLKKIKLNKREHIADLCDSVGIGHVRNRIIKNLSKGYQQRVGVAQAMLGNPGLLILDEPTVGLDPKQILEVRELIRKLGESCAVIFSSHILQEIQAVCERIIIINDGLLIADGSPGELAAKTSRDNRLVVCAEAPREKLLPLLQGLSGVVSVEVLREAESGVWEYSIETGEADPRREIFALLSGKNWPLLSLGKTGMTLEDVFLRLTAGDSAAISALAGNEKPVEGPAAEGGAGEEVE